MRVKSILSFVVICTTLLAAMLGSQGCANIVPPAGGVRDSLPPKLIDVRPGDSARNFAANRIVFSFDEYVDLDNAQQNIIVSPVPKSQPIISRKLNVVTVRLRDSLEENTTYTINFGRAIKDVNEGNPLTDFTFLFATGPDIDSLEIRGRVLLAETGEIDTTLTVMLHNTGYDSAVIKQKPRYVAKLDPTGNFVFRSLPKDTFYVYALADQGGSYRYMNTKSLFGFADSAIIAGSQTGPVTLYAYSETKAIEPARANPTLTGGRTTSADKRLKVQTNLSEERQDLLEKFKLRFDTPLKTFDSTKLILTTDTTYSPVAGFSWQLDSTRKEAILSVTWQESTTYHLELGKEFATDSLGRQLLKTDTLDFTTRATADYGKIGIRFRNLDLSKNPVLLFYQSEELKGSFPLSSINFSQPMFLPGEYNLRILYDENKNGKWDPGSFFVKRKQPEMIRPVQRTITIRPNWTNEFEIDVNAATGPKLPTTTQQQQQQANPGRNNNIRRPAGGTLQRQ
jgi:hypothetical protein